MKFAFPICAFLSLVCISIGQSAFAEEAKPSSKPSSKKATTVSTTAARAKLPTNHAYQRTLRDYLGKLTEKDFEHGVTDLVTVSEEELTPEEQYRLFIMNMMQQPLVGTKRGAPAVNAPAWLFLLSTIEGEAEPPVDENAKPRVRNLKSKEWIRIPVRDPKGIVVPPVWPESLISFVEWDYPGNPYYQNRALKMRAFVTAVVKMVMVDDYFEKTPTSHRADLNGYKLICYGSTYLGVKDLLPPEIQRAFETGLLKLGREMISWGVYGENPNRDMCMPVGLWYVAQATKDPAFSKAAEDYSRKLMTDPHYFHPAGYWVERGGGPDVGYGGGANFYAIWAALATDWPFAKETVQRAYRLRTHLSLTDPDGFITGPSHFNSRLGSPAAADQWAWDGARDPAAAMISDEAVCFIQVPTKEELAEAVAKRVARFNFQIKQNPVHPDIEGRTSAKNTGYWENEELRGATWTWRMWQSFNFPIGLNIGYSFYQPQAYAQLAKLQQTNSPMLKTPMDRGETFLRNFDDAFVVTRQAEYGAILHTGSVGSQSPSDKLPMYPGPLGFGGGQLSAFWTPQTGSVILGRRIALRYEVNFDTLESWRKWPIHAISGCTESGTVFTSARNTKPDAAFKLKEEQGSVMVKGQLLAVKFEQETKLAAPLDYERTLTMESGGVRVESHVSSAGQEPLAELYETLPIFLRDTRRQAKAEPTKIEFETAGKLVPATAEYQKEVTAVLLTRFDGAVRVTFDRPRRVKLSPEDWQDTYLTRGVCRNVMVDLLETGDQPKALKDAKVSYRIVAATKPAE